LKSAPTQVKKGEETDWIKAMRLAATGATAGSSNIANVAYTASLNAPATYTNAAALSGR
jgi:hypothetical protein